MQRAPENTFPAFEMAIEKGIDVIEFDLHQSKDGELVIHHDYALGRTSTGSGMIGDLTLEELKAQEAGSWFAPSFSGITIPIFGEILATFKGQIRFEIELKCATTSFLDSVVREIEFHHVFEDVEITSPHVPLLQFANRAYPGLRLGYFVPPFPKWKTRQLGIQHLIQWMELIGAQVAHLPNDILFSPIVEALQEQELLVHAANLNDKFQIQQAISMSVDQFSTDDIDLAIRTRRGLVEETPK